jgi:hypothetical protein
MKSGWGKLPLIRNNMGGAVCAAHKSVTSFISPDRTGLRRKREVITPGPAPKGIRKM